MQGNKTKIFAYGNNLQASCDGDLEEVNDIFEDSGIIICCGKQFFEVFQITQDNKLQKHSKILISQNGSLVNETITSIILFNQLLICGHESGLLSIWRPSPKDNPILKFEGSARIHQGRINKIYIKKNVKPDNSVEHFAITCSSDHSVKIFNADQAFNQINQFDLGSPVFDIFESLDFDNRDLFLLPLDQGIIQVNDNNFNKVFEIWSNHKYSGKKRKCLTIINPKKDQTYGNFLISTDGTFLDINIWVKKEVIQQKYPPQAPHGGNHPHGGFTHPHRGGGAGRGAPHH